METKWGSLSRLQTSFPAGPAGRRPACLFLSALALASSAGAQSPTFEVASVKWARLVGDYRISGPPWLNDERYDITAKAADPASIERTGRSCPSCAIGEIERTGRSCPSCAIGEIDELRQMLRTLLAERFQLRVHRETKELPVYALVAAKSGPKLHKAEPHSNTDMHGENGSFVFHGTSMPQFAEDLSTLSQVDRPVLDRTGIPGGLRFQPEVRRE
jgi:uncharacterized protein (TIGR03435 family)